MPPTIRSALPLNPARRLFALLLPFVIGAVFVCDGIAFPRAAHAQQQQDNPQTKQATVSVRASLASM